MNRKLSERARSIKSFISALEIIKAEIVFRALTLPDIMEIICRECRGASGNYFLRVKKTMDEEKRSFWVSAGQWMPSLKAYGLTEADTRHISSALYCLGRYDSAAQAETISTSIAGLNRELEEAARDMREKGKIYRAMGMTVGIMLALIAI